MQFIKSSIWAGSSVVVKAVSSIVINKLIARFFLPSDFALLAHFQNFLGIFLTVSTEGVNKGVIKYISDVQTDEVKKNKIILAGLIMNIALFFAAVIGILLFRNYFTFYFARDIPDFWWVVLIIGILLLLLINYFFLAVILARGELRTYILINVFSTLVGIVLVYFAASLTNFSFTLLVIGLTPGLLFIVSCFLALRHISLKLIRISSLKDGLSYKQLGEFIIMAVSVMIFGKIVELLVRQYSFVSFDAYQTGLWQSVVKFSDYYMFAFTNILSIVYFPQLSRLANQADELKKYVKSVIYLVAPASLCLLLTVYFLREYILIFFFDEKFNEGAYLFTFQLSGDFLRMMSYLLSFIVIAQARTWLFISLQAGSTIIYILLVLGSTSLWGMEGFPIAHFFRFSAYLLALIIVYRKIISS